MTRRTLLDDVTVKIAKENLKQLGNYGIRSVKLKAVIAAKDHGIGLTAEVFDVNRKTLTSWVKEVNANNIDKLAVQPGRGRKPKFNEGHKAKVASWLNNEPTITIDKLLKMISSKFKLEVSRATVHRLMKELQFAYITPRPLHYKQDKAQQSEFKKKLSIIAKENPDAEVMFFDESRFGTHSKLGHGWFNKGSRAQIKISMGFKNFYVYSAVSSLTGDSFSLILPYVNTECMNIFLKNISLQYKCSKLIIVLDGASWHRSVNLAIPANISIIHLPPYSPELNPVERLWNYLKSNTIKNRFYDSLAYLEQAVCKFLRRITPDVIRSVCSCDYITSNYI